jgi:hypothetical protein
MITTKLNINIRPGPFVGMRFWIDPENFEWCDNKTCSGWMTITEKWASATLREYEDSYYIYRSKCDCGSYQSPDNGMFSARDWPHLVWDTLRLPGELDCPSDPRYRRDWQPGDEAWYLCDGSWVHLQAELNEANGIGFRATDGSDTWNITFFPQSGLPEWMPEKLLYIPKSQSRSKPSVISRKEQILELVIGSLDD